MRLAVGAAGLPDLGDASIVEGEAPAVLDRIHEARVVLAIWRRHVSTGVRRWLDALPAHRLPEGHFIGPAACVSGRLSALCDLVEIEDSSQRCEFIADVAQLAGLFAALTDCSDIDLRLEAIDHDSCWRFHRDHVGYRLNATYRGPGTQWIAPEHANRALRLQRRYRGPLHELPRFAAGLFKGAVRAGTAAAVHRSPPISGNGQTRLFLCLNEVREDE